MLILQEPCKTCQGCGRVPSPAWKDWYAAHPNWNTLDVSSPVDPATGEVFCEEPTEPEELYCIECEGSGKQLTEDGKAVMDLINHVLRTQYYSQESAARHHQTGTVTPIEEEAQL